MPATEAPLTHTEIRGLYPALDSGFAFLENAGGSQVPGMVIDAIAQFMRESYVQPGAGYAASDRATGVLQAAHAFVNTYLNGDGIGEVVFGPSSTNLVYLLAQAFAPTVRPGDEIVVSVANHEANIGAWVRLADRGAVVRWWGVDPVSGESRLDDLAELLTDRTRILAFPQTSNILGEVNDAARIAQMARAVGAVSVCDGVAYASHRAPDVAALGCDFYFYSAYKVYGPHMAALFGRHEAWAPLEGPNHFFIPRDELPRKFELGCPNYEGCAGLIAYGEYLARLAGRATVDRATVESASAVMEACEQPVQERLVGYLADHPRVRFIGPRHSGRDRVPIVSFVPYAVSPAEAVARVHEHPIGVRYGHMYAVRLCEALGIDPEAGVVRVSAVHYNSPDEIDRLTAVLDRVL